jgi:hypothetical protein
VNFAPEGYPFIIAATVLAVITYGLALRLRSWPLWLAAFGFTVAALLCSWIFREVNPTAMAGATARLVT